MTDDFALPEGTLILSADDADFVQRFRDAIGLKPGEKISVICPQFTRTDGLQVPHPNDLDWSKLAELPDNALEALGLQCWDRTVDGALWLFPAEWYPHIPAGLKVVTINEKVKGFAPGVTDDDQRFGALPYGVFVPVKQGDAP